jgi:hypothetical protein
VSQTFWTRSAGVRERATRAPQNRPDGIAMPEPPAPGKTRHPRAIRSVLLGRCPALTGSLRGTTHPSPPERIPASPGLMPAVAPRRQPLQELVPAQDIGEVQHFDPAIAVEPHGRASLSIMRFREVAVPADTETS